MTLPTVKISETQEKLAEELIPQSCKDTLASLKRGERGVHYKTSYLPDTVKAILLNIMRGMPRGAAASMAGVKAGTVYNWVSEHPDLADALARAEACCQAEWLEVIQRNAEKRPQLLVELLKLRFPKDWAPTIRTEHSGAVAGVIGTPDWFAKVSSARLKRDGMLPEPEELSGGQPARMLGNSQESIEVPTHSPTHSEAEPALRPGPAAGPAAAPTSLPTPPSPNDGAPGAAGGSL